MHSRPCPESCAKRETRQSYILKNYHFDIHSLTLGLTDSRQRLGEFTRPKLEALFLLWDAHSRAKEGVHSPTKVPCGHRNSVRLELLAVRNPLVA